VVWSAEREVGRVVWSVPFGPDGQAFAAGGLRGLVLWRVEGEPTTGEDRSPLSLSRVARLADQSSSSVCFSPDGRRLAWVEPSSTHPTVHLWDARTRQSRQLPGAETAHEILALAFYPDSRHLAFVSSRHEVEVWDVEAGRLASSFGGGELRARGASTESSAITALSRDGALYAVGCRAVTIWDESQRALSLILPEERSTVWSLAWSRQPELLAVGTSDGGLAVWSLPKVEEQLAQIGLGRTTATAP